MRPLGLKPTMNAGTPEITFDIAENGDTITFACSGPLTIDTIEVLRKKLDGITSSPTLKRLFFDLSNVPAVDPSGIGLLVDLHARLVEGRRRVYFFRPTKPVRSLIDELGLSDFLRCLGHEDELLIRMPDQPK